MHRAVPNYRGECLSGTRRLVLEEKRGTNIPNDCTWEYQTAPGLSHMNNSVEFRHSYSSSCVSFQGSLAVVQIILIAVFKAGDHVTLGHLQSNTQLVLWDQHCRCNWKLTLIVDLSYRTTVNQPALLEYITVLLVSVLRITKPIERWALDLSLNFQVFVSETDLLSHCLVCCNFINNFCLFCLRHILLGLK